jgi:hypothetical protein
MDFLTGRGPSCSILEKEYYRIHYSIVNGYYLGNSINRIVLLIVKCL